MLLRNKLNVRKKHSDSIGEKGGQGKGGKGRKTAKKKRKCNNLIWDYYLFYFVASRLHK